MRHLLVLCLLAAPPPEPEYFRLDLSPSGHQVSIGAPVVKGGMLLFHAYPDGKLMSLRRTNTATVVGGAPGQPGGAGAPGSSGPALTRPIQQGIAAAEAASTATVPHTPD